MKAFVLAINLFKKALNHKIRLFIYVFVPVIALYLPLLFGHLNKPTITPIGVWDQDCSVASKQLIKKLETDYHFFIMPLTSQQIEKALVTEEVQVVVHIPANFQVSLQSKTPLSLHTFYTKESVEEVLVGQILGTLTSTAALFSNGEKIKFYEANDQSSIPSKNVGFTMILMSLMTTTVLSGMIEERKNLIYHRILSTSTSYSTYLKGHLLWISGLGMFQIIFLVVLCSLIPLSYPIALGHLVFLLVLMLVISLAFGVVLIALSTTQEHLALLNMLIILPSAMVSGCLWPTYSMHPILEQVGKYFPQYYLMDIAIKLEQNQPYSTWTKSLVLLLIGCIILFTIGKVTLERQGVKDFG